MHVARNPKLRHNLRFPCGNRARLFGLWFFASDGNRPFPRPANSRDCTVTLPARNGSKHPSPARYLERHTLAFDRAIACGLPLGHTVRRLVPGQYPGSAHAGGPWFLCPDLHCLAVAWLCLENHAGSRSFCFDRLCIGTVQWRLQHRRTARHTVLFRLARRQYRGSRLAYHLLSAEPT